MSKTITANVPIAKVGGIGVDTSLMQTKKCYVQNSRGISHIVMHYTGNAKDTAKANANYVINGNSDVSAHYFVDDNSIYQSVALKNAAWHAGQKSMNLKSVGIEMCCSGNYQMSAKTIENSAQLVAELCKLLGIKAADVDKYIIRHYDVTGKNCPAPWVKNPSQWAAFKSRVKTLLGGASQTTTKPTVTANSSFLVRVIDNNLNIRKGAGTSYAVVGQIKDHGTYTIVETKGTVGQAGSWGKLKSGAGWISLNSCYVKRVK